jgi:hypothetical protein
VARTFPAPTAIARRDQPYFGIRNRDFNGPAGM